MNMKNFAYKIANSSSQI